MGIEARPLIAKSSTILFELIWHVLLRRSSNFSSCTTWFLDLDDLVRINGAWLYKELKVSVLQANVKLVQKGKYWTWLWEAWLLFPLGIKFCHLTFFGFHVILTSAVGIWHFRLVCEKLGYCIDIKSEFTYPPLQSVTLQLTLTTFSPSKTITSIEFSQNYDLINLSN